MPGHLLNLNRRSGRIWWSVIFVCVILASSGNAYAYDGHESSLWTEVGLRHKIMKKLALDWRGYWRFDDFASKTDKVMTQISLRYGVLKFLRLTPGYRHIREVNKAGDFETAYRFYVDTTLRKEDKPFTYGYRLRLQREEEADSGEYEYRVRNKIELKWKLSRRARPLISTEHFLTQKKDGWEETRFRNSAGIELRMGEHTVSLLYKQNWPVSDHDDPLTHILAIGYGAEL